MSSSSPGAYAEHHFKKVIPGEVEVRRRLYDVLEQFNSSSSVKIPFRQSVSRKRVSRG